MTTTEIYTLAAELTNKEINNVLAAWDNTGETKIVNEFNVLVDLGDSRGLALATLIAKKYSGVNGYESYYNAYCI